ncbi:MAG: glycine--tRNA ligase subunit beta [Gammaproteobacteria bacterium]
MSRPQACDLLIEIGTEELPASAQVPLAAALRTSLAAALSERGLAATELESFSTPRRLTVLAFKVPPFEPDRQTERRGPSLRAAFDGEGRPTRAALGFARSVGIDVETLEKRREPEGEWLIYRQAVHGQPISAILIAIMPRLFANLPLPRRMRWNAGDASFLRPVRWLTVRYGDEAIPVEAFGLTAGGESRGHRLHHPGPVALRTPSDYAEALKYAHVIADPVAREDEIRRQVAAAAHKAGGIPAAPEGLYAEITGMLEWPVALAGRFDAKFLNLPDAVLVTTLAHHQRFIPVRDGEKGLRVEFVAVADLESRDPAAVRHGLERVVRSRLEDAAFYYRRDRERALSDYTDDLAGLAFGPELGSMADKSVRLAHLAAEVATATGADAQAAARAGALAKCDLVTGLVFEFPELQGLMGGHYATESGESDTVAQAIAEQYRPTGAADALPASPVGTAVALADRLDTLVGGFAAGLQPTGTKDPFGLRRAAFGLLRIAAERAPGLNLEPLLETAANLYTEKLDVVQTLPAVKDFLHERLRSLILEQARGTDVARAVLAGAPLVPGEVMARAAALTKFRLRPEAAALAAANKRIANILRQAGETTNDRATTAAQPEPAEAALSGALDATCVTLGLALKRRDFTGAFEALAGLREPVDRFFEEVLVMDPDPALRARRLGLLKRLRAAFLEIADIGELQGTGEA